MGARSSFGRLDGLHEITEITGHSSVGLRGLDVDRHLLGRERHTVGQARDMVGQARGTG